MIARQVFIMRGIPGSGKSTWVRQQCKKYGKDVIVVSADNFFEKNGQYNFDVALLGEAHRTCLLSFLTELNRGTRVVIVDNTCIHAVDLAPYYAVAEAVGYSACVVQMICDPDMAATRNIHQVPPDQVLKMAKSMDSLPPYWDVRYVYEK